MVYYRTLKNQQKRTVRKVIQVRQAFPLLATVLSIKKRVEKILVLIMFSKVSSELILSKLLRLLSIATHFRF